MVPFASEQSPKESDITHRNVETYSREDFPNMVGDDPVSELKVMQSAAGYYIGRSYFDLECGCEFPFSRESEYMTKADAVQRLKYDTYVVRDCIENNAMYDAGDLPDPREERAAAEDAYWEAQWQYECMLEEERAEEEQAWRDEHGYD